MLGELDTFLAFAAVMLGVSLFVTAINQTLAAWFKIRSSFLEQGLVRLLHHVTPELGVRAETVVDLALHHPLLADSKLAGNDRTERGATAIRKEELTNLLKGDHFWASAARRWAHSELKAQGELTAAAALVAIPEAKWFTVWCGLFEQTASSRATEGTEGTGAATTALAVVRDELASRALWNAIGAGRQESVLRVGAGLVEFANAELSKQRIVQQVTLWFDAAMDRTTQLFATRMRWITLGVSAVLVLLMQLDAFSLLQKLSDQPQLRAKIIAEMDNLETRYAAQQTLLSTVQAQQTLLTTINAAKPGELRADAGGLGQPTPKAEASAPTAEQLFEQQVAELKQAQASLQAMGFRLLPEKLAWPRLPQLPGLLASMVLLSLGAPFWFNLLRQLSSLRPVVAGLEQQERQRRGGPEKA